MIQSVNTTLVEPEVENHEAFIDRLVTLGHSSALIAREDEAYEFAKAAHRSQNREGEVDQNGMPLRYFEHPRAVMIVITDELQPELGALPDGVQAVLIMGALLHDVPEDTALFGNRLTEIPGDKREWRELVRERIDRIDPIALDPTADDGKTPTELHHQKLSTIVLGVTKLEEQELRTLGILPEDPNYKELKLHLSVQMVRIAGPAAVVIKAADRLANLRTMDNFEAARVLKKIEETEKHFLPLFEEFSVPENGGEFAPLTAKLTELIRKEINQLRTRLDIAALPQTS